MASNAQSGVGVQLKRGAGSPLSYTAIAEILTITNTKTRKVIDVTNLDSDGGYEEFIAGFRNGGTFRCTANFTYTGYEDLNDDYESEDLVSYQVVVPDPQDTTFEFDGLVTSLGFAVDKDTAIKSDFEITVSGVIDISNTG
jgi:predicted secreted protein